MSFNNKLHMLVGATLILNALTGHALITENGPSYTTYPLNTATIPALSAAGSKGSDPTFGTDIMRLTDGSDGSTSCSNAYSYWPVFNKDSTRLAVRCNFTTSPTTKTIFYSLNASAFTVSGYQAVPYLSGDMIWSALNPDLIYTRSGAGGGAWYGPTLNSYNVSTGTTTLVKNFSTLLPANYGLNQMSRSMDDDIWAFTVVDATGVFTGYLVWKKSTDLVLLNQTFSSPYNDHYGNPEKVDEVQIDKSGRFLTVQGNGNYTQVWDLQALAMTQLVVGVDAYVHEDTGHGTVLSGCASGPGVCFRKLSQPQTAPTILPFSSWSQANDHFTMLADNEAWGLVTNENINYAVTLPFHGEIFQVATNGSGQVRRIAHHNSSVATYGQNAFGNISRDGRFVAWTSDWGSNLTPGSMRTDVYIAKIDAAPKIPSPISGPLSTLSLSAASSDTGFAYLVQQAFGTLADASAFPARSTLRVFEDGMELSPPHSAHADIRSVGLGSFSHWLGGGIETLRISATDNSDPRTNGRTYRYNVPDLQSPLNVSAAVSDTGYAYLIGGVSFGNLADNTTYKNQSTLRLFENGVELKPAHSLHADIRSTGNGRFSHNKVLGYEALRFSASDNTDPRTNGRTYTYIIDTLP